MATLTTPARSLMNVVLVDGGASSMRESLKHQPFLNVVEENEKEKENEDEINEPQADDLTEYLIVSQDLDR